VAKMNKTSKWLEDRLPVRRDVAAKLETVERERFAEPEGVMKVIAAYPEIARDLAIARREAPRGPLTRRLERIYRELHRAIFRSPTRWRQDLAALFVSDAAEIAYSLRWHIDWVTALFFASASAGAW